MTKECKDRKAVEAQEAAANFEALDANTKAYIQGVIDGANFAKGAAQKEPAGDSSND